MSAGLVLKTRILESLRRGFAGRVLVLSSGSLVGQALGLVSAPFISRLYSPQNLGALGAFVSALTLISVVAALRFEVAIPAATTDADAADVLVLAVLVSAATSCIVGVVLWLAGSQILPSVARSLPGVLLVLLPIGMFATALYQSLSMWMIRTGDFATLGTTRITQSATVSASQLALGWRGMGAIGLIVGQILGSFGGLLRLSRRLFAGNADLFAHVSRERVVAAARRLRRFPQYSAPAVILDASIGNAPLLFVAATHGMAAAGFFTLVQRWLFVPLNLLAGNIAQVFFSDLARMLREDPAAMRAMFVRRVQMAVVGALLLVICLALIVPHVVGLVFGQQWVVAGRYFVLLTPLLFGGLISSPFGGALDVLQRQDLHLVREVARALVTALMLFTAQVTHAGIESTLVLISAAGLINGVIYLYISWLSIARHVVTTSEPSDAIWPSDAMGEVKI